MQDNRVAGMEYLPSGLRPEFIDKNRDTVGTEPANIVIRYHGYKGTYTSPEGETSRIPVKRSENGLVLIQLPNSSSGTIHVAYQKTAFEKAGEVISLLTLFSIIFFIIQKQKKKLLFVQFHL